RRVERNRDVVAALTVERIERRPVGHDGREAVAERPLPDPAWAGGRPARGQSRGVGNEVARRAAPLRPRRPARRGRPGSRRHRARDRADDESGAHYRRPDGPGSNSFGSSGSLIVTASMVRVREGSGAPSNVALIANGTSTPFTWR